MLRQISIFIFICFSSLCVLAQTEKYTAPIKLERYKVSDQDISVLFPKLPILIRDSNVCIEQESSKYAAYAEGVVYGLNIIYKSKQKVPDFCREKRKFDANSFKGGIKEVKSFLKAEQETKFDQNNFEVIKIKGERFTYWLIDDFENKRWFEFWATTEDEENQTVKNLSNQSNWKKTQWELKLGRVRTERSVTLRQPINRVKTKIQ